MVLVSPIKGHTKSVFIKKVIRHSRAGIAELLLSVASYYFYITVPFSGIFLGSETDGWPVALESR